MPGFHGGETATGELAQVTGDMGDSVFRKSPFEDIYRKVTKNSVTICHLSPEIPSSIIAHTRRQGRTDTEPLTKLRGDVIRDDRGEGESTPGGLERSSRR